MTSDRPIGETLLILNAKYHESEADRRFAGEELVRCCSENLDHAILVQILKDEGFPQAIMQLASGALAIVMEALAGDGESGIPIERLTDKDLPLRDRERIGLALVNACITRQDPGPLVIVLKKSRDCPGLAIEQAKRALPEIVMAGAARSGDTTLIGSLASDQELTSQLRQLFGMRLYELLSQSEDLSGLMRLAEGKEFHDEARKAATTKIFNYYEGAGSFTSMQAMAENGSLLYEARKSIAMRIADLCIASGNYPLLITMSTSGLIPLNMRLDIEDRIELAARKALEDALSAGDRTVLQFIANDERLGGGIRERASSSIGSLDKDGKAGGPQADGRDLAARLARTLGRESQPPQTPRKISH